MKIYDKVIDLYLKENLILKKSSYGNYHIIDGLHTGGGITKLEVEYIEKYKDEFLSPNIFIIGNAFGFSTFVFSKIFKNASIDVIDAETEGNDNKVGSKITKDIAIKNNLNINLTIGYSPADVEKAMRHKIYDIVFIDGLHTNDQIILDFDAIKSFLNNEKYICFFHDIRLFKLENGFNDILKNNISLYDNCVISLDKEISESGIGIISKGVAIK